MHCSLPPQQFLQSLKGCHQHHPEVVGRGKQPCSKHPGILGGAHYSLGPESSPSSPSIVSRGPQGYGCSSCLIQDKMSCAEMRDSVVRKEGSLRFIHFQLVYHRRTKDHFACRGSGHVEGGGVGIRVYLRGPSCPLKPSYMGSPCYTLQSCQRGGSSSQSLGSSRVRLEPRTSNCPLSPRGMLGPGQARPEEGSALIAHSAMADSEV